MPDSVFSFLEIIAGVNELGKIDRNALWAFFTTVMTSIIAGVAWWQLRTGNKTAKADFMHKFKTDFFTKEARLLIYLFENGLIQYIAEDKKEGIQSHFKILSDEIDEETKNSLELKHTIFTAYDIDDHLLGHFENLGIFEKEKMINIVLVYEFFEYYIKIFWENEEIKKYVKNIRSEKEENLDIFDKFEYIYKKSRSYGEAKRGKKIILFWRMKWWFCNKFGVLDKPQV